MHAAAAQTDDVRFAIQVKLALQKLACVSTTPSIALNEAAELLCKHLTVGLCR